MGSSSSTVAALCSAALIACASARAYAESECTGGEAPRLFAACFDIGNRLYLTATTADVGLGVDLRHTMLFEDEPDLVWKLQHHFAHADLSLDAEVVEGSLYRGTYLRHARDGHIVLPLGLPQKIFLPFDIGAQARLATLRAERGVDRLDFEMLQAAALVDLGRSPSFGRRLALGFSSRWDLGIDHRERRIVEHRVAPFSTAVINLRHESASGLAVGEAIAEAGWIWSNQDGWQRSARASATVERTMIAINDRPLSLFASGSYEFDGEAKALLGIRFAVVQHTDKRVNTAPLRLRSPAGNGDPSANTHRR